MLDSGTPWSSRTRIAITACQSASTLGDSLAAAPVPICGVSSDAEVTFDQTDTYLRIQEEYPNILGLFTTLDTIRQFAVEQKRFTRPWVRLDEHSTDLHIPDHTAKTV